MSEIITSTSTKQTQDLAAKLLHQYSHRVIALIGPLGAGKTTFAQGLGASLGIKKMLSPTYTLIRQYPLSSKANFSTLYHIDLYRLASFDEITMLGLEEILADPHNLVLIEWPEKILDTLPPHLEIQFEKLPNNDRQITISEVQ